MKKLILFAAILFAGVTVVKTQAQEGHSSKLSVELHPFQTILVSGESTIKFTDASHYKQGTSVTEITGNTLVTVNSAGSFVVAVKANDLEQVGNATNTLKANTINVEAKAENTEVPNEIKVACTLGNENGDALIKGAGGFDMKYKVEFTANGGDAYRTAYNNGLKTENFQNYTTTVYYTVSAN